LKNRPDVGEKKAKDTYAANTYAANNVPNLRTVVMAAEGLSAPKEPNVETVCTKRAQRRNKSDLGALKETNET
jgi:hypothetical protein